MNRKRLTAVLVVAVGGALSLTATAQAAYSDQVLESEPLMYLRLDEASGSTAHDASPNGNDGDVRR